MCLSTLGEFSAIFRAVRFGCLCHWGRFLRNCQRCFSGSLQRCSDSRELDCISEAEEASKCIFHNWSFRLQTQRVSHILHIPAWQKSRQTVFAGCTWEVEKTCIYKTTKEAPRHSSLLFLSSSVLEKDTKTDCVRVCACLCLCVLPAVTQGGVNGAKVVRFTESDTLPRKSLRSSQIRNLVALSQMPVSHLKGWGTYELVRW